MIDESVTIHSAAIVEKNVSIGANTRVWAYTHILSDVKIGSGCNICDFAYIENGVVIGSEVTIKSGIYIWSGIEIKDRVFLGPNVVFTNDLRPRSRADFSLSPTVVDEGASVGANSVIVCGNTVGKYSLIGAGSVVTHDVPMFGLVYGNPARLRGFVCKCSKDLLFDGHGHGKCSCGLNYRKKSEKSIELI